MHFTYGRDERLFPQRTTAFAAFGHNIFSLNAHMYRILYYNAHRDQRRQWQQ